MSDFDKEAERERLREKYEREEEKREVTERMSELLLKGATMTNAHCQECGDPIFRYDGQEFCATCQRTIERDGDDDGGAAESNGEGDEIEVAAPGETRVQFGGAEAESEAQPETAADEAEPEADDGKPSGQPVSSQQDEQAPDDTHVPIDEPQSTDARTVDGDLAEAGDSLVRSVTQLAQRAEATDDLGRKRDLLAATREAAEALSAVREAGA